MQLQSRLLPRKVLGPGIHIQKDRGVNILAACPDNTMGVPEVYIETSIIKLWTSLKTSSYRNTKYHNYWFFQ